MVSHLFYYQLALLAIMWLFVMLHVTWSKPRPDHPSRASYSPSASAPPSPKRSRA